MKTVSKIKSPESLLEWRGQMGATGVTVVAGTFDLFQPGNLYAIRTAAALGAPVMVVVEPDDVVVRHVPAGRPQHSLETRIEMVSHLREVAVVTSLAEGKESGFFRKLAPFVAVADRSGQPQPYRQILEATATRLEEIGLLPGCFTGDIIRSIKEHQTPILLPGGWDANPVHRKLILKPGRVTVAVNGCFDILHVGHLRLLAKARGMGDSLSVLVNSDASVVRYKGPTRPVFPEAFRVATLTALSSVDEVLVFSGDNPLAELRQLRPMIHVKGGSYEADRVREERELLESWGGRLVCTPMVDAFSTTRFIHHALNSGSHVQDSPPGEKCDNV